MNFTTSTKIEAEVVTEETAVPYNKEKVAIIPKKDQPMLFPWSLEVT